MGTRPEGEKSPGYKLDKDKARWDLLPSDALEQVAEVMRYGARKYEERNWERGMEWHRPFRALLNHSWAWWRGEDLDSESGLNHMAHAACNALFLLAYALRSGVGVDDRERLALRDPRAIIDPLNGEVGK